MAQTIENKAIYRIRGTGRGWAFSPPDFLDFGGRATVDSALHRLKRRGKIRSAIDFQERFYYSSWARIQVDSTRESDCRAGT